MVQSLNISVACAVSVYEAYRQKSIAGHYQQPQIVGQELVDLKLQWGFNEDDGL